MNTSGKDPSRKTAAQINPLEGAEISLNQAFLLPHNSSEHVQIIIPKQMQTNKQTLSPADQEMRNLITVVKLQTTL